MKLAHATRGATGLPTAQVWFASAPIITPVWPGAAAEEGITAGNTRTAAEVDGHCKECTWCG